MKIQELQVYECRHILTQICFLKNTSFNRVFPKPLYYNNQRQEKAVRAAVSSMHCLYLTGVFFSFAFFYNQFYSF